MNHPGNIRQPQVQPRQSPMGPHPPPPYRAPPPALYPTTPLSTKPYSKFNVSEPNIVPTNRHTFNNENGPQIQSNLRNLLAATPKHSTLDGQGQNVMLQHLRNRYVVNKQEDGIIVRYQSQSEVIKVTLLYYVQIIQRTNTYMKKYMVVFIGQTNDFTVPENKICTPKQGLQ